MSTCTLSAATISTSTVHLAETRNDYQPIRRTPGTGMKQKVQIETKPGINVLIQPRSMNQMVTATCCIVGHFVRAGKYRTGEGGVRKKDVCYLVNCLFQIEVCWGLLFQLYCCDVIVSTKIETAQRDVVYRRAVCSISLLASSATPRGHHQHRVFIVTTA